MREKKRKTEKEKKIENRCPRNGRLLFPFQAFSASVSFPLFCPRWQRERRRKQHNLRLSRRVIVSLILTNGFYNFTTSSIKCSEHLVVKCLKETGVIYQHKCKQVCYSLFCTKQLHYQY